MLQNLSENTAHVEDFSDEAERGGGACPLVSRAPLRSLWSTPSSMPVAKKLRGHVTCGPHLLSLARPLCFWLTFAASGKLSNIFTSAYWPLRSSLHIQKMEKVIDPLLIIITATDLMISFVAALSSCELIRLQDTGVICSVVFVRCTCSDSNHSSDAFCWATARGVRPVAESRGTGIVMQQTDHFMVPDEGIRLWRISRGRWLGSDSELCVCLPSEIS